MPSQQEETIMKNNQQMLQQMVYLGNDGENGKVSNHREGIFMKYTEKKTKQVKLFSFIFQTDLVFTFKPSNEKCCHSQKESNETNEKHLGPCQIEIVWSPMVDRTNS